VQNVTVANAYLARAGALLDPIARGYVEACCAAPFSFHEVIDVRPGEGFRLRDVMLGAEAQVTEHSGSAHVEPGDILFAKLVPVEGLHLVEGMGPVAIPPVHKPALVDLRKRLGSRDSLFGSDVLRAFDPGGSERTAALPQTDWLRDTRLQPHGPTHLEKTAACGRPRRPTRSLGPV